MSRGAWRLLQALAVVAVLVFVGMQVSDHWAELRSIPGTLRVDWLVMAGSAGVVLASYAVLIWTWQRTVVAWGERISFAEAARIWFISNLGRYLPGKVWQIGAMGVMAQRAGVSPTAAVGSSLVISLINILAGAAVAFATGARNLGAPQWAVPALIAAAAVTIATPWLLPVMARVAGAILRRKIQSPTLPASAVWIAAAGCAAAWVLYGIAFHLMQVSIIGPGAGDMVRSTAAFTASYIVGFLAIFAPGGLGVREDILHRLLEAFGIAVGAQAWLVVFASRIWLTIIEVLPGLVLLVVRPESPQPSSTKAA